MADKDMEVMGSAQAGTTFQFSHAPLATLGASEYTLVAICLDESYSIRNFDKQMSDCLKAVVESCRKCPRADNLMLRLLGFASDVQEHHGFKELQHCHAGDYDGFPAPRGMTALFDASVNAVESVWSFGESLYDQDYEVNAIVFVVTDGDDNSSSTNPAAISAAVQKALHSEKLESILVLLVGVNTKDCKVYLERLKDEGDFTDYLDIKDANAKSLARLASWVSQSISSQSDSLGTKGPSRDVNSLTF
jgi:uncharacterized protein YegL